MFHKFIHYYKFVLIVSICMQTTCYVSGQHQLEFPAGTQLNVQGDIISYELPEGYMLVGDVIGQPSISLAAAPDGSVKCSCESDKGDCSPWRRGNQSGCSTSNSSCSKCTMETSKFIASESQLTNLRIKKKAETEIGYLTFLSKVFPITNLSELNGKAYVDKQTLEIPEIQELIRETYNSLVEPEMLDQVLQGQVPAGYVYVPFSIDGKLGLLVMPSEKVGNYGSIGIFPKTELCNGCERKCRRGSSMGVSYCEGCSSGCTLSW